MPIRVDDQGRITSYEAHEVLPADYLLGSVEAPVVEPEPAPEPVAEAKSANGRRRTARVTTTTETQGPVQQERLTLTEDDAEESEDAASGGDTGGSGDSSDLSGHAT